MNHPIIEASYIDANGEPGRLVLCPDCNQMEWWTAAECLDHGRCRALPELILCPVCEAPSTKPRTGHKIGYEQRQLNAAD
jgi:hypothetical protein